VDEVEDVVVFTMNGIGVMIGTVIVIAGEDTKMKVLKRLHEEDITIDMTREKQDMVALLIPITEIPCHPLCLSQAMHRTVLLPM